MGWFYFWWGNELSVSPSTIPSGEAIGTPTLVTTATVGLPGIPSKEAVGVPTILATNDLAIGGIPSGEVIGLPSLLLERIVSMSGIAGGTVGVPLVQPGPVTIAPPGIGSGEQIGQASVYLYLLPLSIGTGEVVPGPVLVQGVPPIRLSGVASEEAIGVPTVVVTPDYAPIAGFEAKERTFAT